MGENPMVSDPDLNHVRHCLEQTEFLVVQDIFLTETAEMAHVVLPGVTFAEKDGTFTNTERRVQRVRKAIKPLGDAKEDWVIICELAKKMGAKGFDFKSAQRDHGRDQQADTPAMAASPTNAWKNLVPCNGPARLWIIRGRPTCTRANSPAAWVSSSRLSSRNPLNFPNEEYPFTLTTGRLMFHFHTGSMTRRSEKLDSEVPEAYVEINVDDAKKIGLNGHKRVRVTSRRGEIELGVRVTDDIKRGVVFIPFHFAEAAANKLTNSAIDPVAKIPEYKVCAVKVDL